jgi:hypothetical protein
VGQCGEKISRPSPRCAVRPPPRAGASVRRRVVVSGLVLATIAPSICSAVDVMTGNTLPRAMSALSYQLVTVTNCAAAVALCIATARDGCRSTNLRRPNNGPERNRSFHSRPAQRRSILRWRMLATNVAQPISRPCDGSTTPYVLVKSKAGLRSTERRHDSHPCRPTRHQPGRQRRVA